MRSSRGSSAGGSAGHDGGQRGIRAGVAPAVRGVAVSGRILRSGKTGLPAIEVFSSDRAPYRFDDAQGKKVHGDQVPFTRVPNGVPGLETRLPILFSEGVQKGRIDLHRFAATTATRPAQLYGLYPRKGTIAIGSDADLAIWDPEAEVTVRKAVLHDTMDYTPYDGLRVKGWPVVTVSRGEVIWMNGEVRGEKGRGEFLRRSTRDQGSGIGDQGSHHARHAASHVDRP
jgi:dihydropyrimidinase